jgi:hypothetical protein
MFIGRSFQEQLSSAGQTLEACKNTLNHSSKPIPPKSKVRKEWEMP